MELLELVNKFKQIFGIDGMEQAQQKLNTVLFDCREKERLFDEWIAVCPDLSRDYMQKIFQYYLADRKNLGQDYTPVCLGALLAELCGGSDGDVVTDMCAGSGSLTIQAWNKNKSLFFTCLEYDERVIPFLLFNLSIRNINAVVKRCDALSGDVFDVYKLTANEKYSDIAREAGFNENLYQ